MGLPKGPSNIGVSRPFHLTWTTYSSCSSLIAFLLYFIFSRKRNEPSDTPALETASKALLGTALQIGDVRVNILRIMSCKVLCMRLRSYDLASTSSLLVKCYALSLALALNFLTLILGVCWMMTQHWAGLLLPSIVPHAWSTVKTGSLPAVSHHGSRSCF